MWQPVNCIALQTNLFQCQSDMCVCICEPVRVTLNQNGMTLCDNKYEEFQNKFLICLLTQFLFLLTTAWGHSIWDQFPYPSQMEKMP